MGGSYVALVSAEKCATCKALKGDRHKVTTPPPSEDIMKCWKSSGFAEATDGYPWEVDGFGHRGHYSWLVSLGKVKKNTFARPKQFRQPTPGLDHSGRGKNLG